MSDVPDHRIIDAIEGMDGLEQLVRQIEAELESAGWDQPFTFMTLVRLPGGSTGAMTATLPPRLYSDPGYVFPKLVEWLRLSAYSDPAPLLETREGAVGIANRLTGGSPDVFYGFAMYGEGWAVHHDLPAETTLEEAKAVFASEPSPMNHPDRVERRFGFAATVKGELVSISRNRGGFPEFSDLLSEGIQSHGPLVDALRTLVTICQDLTA